MANSKTPVIVLGAGPAGLGAAFRLAKRGCFDVTTVERGAEVGGNAGSFDLAGLRVDFGSHRLHPACDPGIMADIRAMLGDDLLERPRHGRIRLQGRWVHFPLKPADLATNLPLSFSTGVALDLVRKALPKPSEDTFASVLEAGLGRTICRDFYFPYARKIWGLGPEELDAEQARRRVSAGSIGKMIRKVMSAVPGLKPAGAGKFYYPRHGYGAISEAYRKAAEQAGASLRLNTTVTGVAMEGGRVAAVRVRSEGGEETLPARQVLSSLPVSLLARLIEPSAPQEILECACALRFRSMILVYLVLEAEQFTEFDAHYFPGADVTITRLSEPKNYGLAELPGRTVLCAELPCSSRDKVFQASDAELGRLVVKDLETAGLRLPGAVRHVQTVRLPQAYPIYTLDYRRHFDRLEEWLSGIEGLVSFGRQGLFAHDNTHHALQMAYALDGCVQDDGELNREKWRECREGFRRHVVED